jgi:hypothetical protein
MSSEVLAEIRRLYFATSKATIADDFDRAIDLLKSLPSDEERERAAVFMEGLAQLRAEWNGSSGSNRARSSSAPQSATARGRFDRSKRGARRPR